MGFGSRRLCHSHSAPAPRRSSVAGDRRGGRLGGRCAGAPSSAGGRDRTRGRSGRAGRGGSSSAALLSAFAPPSPCCAPLYALSTSVRGLPFTAASNNRSRSVDMRRDSRKCPLLAAPKPLPRVTAGSPATTPPQAALGLTEDRAISACHPDFLMRKREGKK